MANSRKSPRRNDVSERTASVVDAFERALGEIRTRVCASAPRRLAIAYSGGLDSSVLLHLARAYAESHGIALLAFHIHHGISTNADDWLKHCEHECARMGVIFDARKVTLRSRDRSGTEEAARTARYAALGDLCRMHRAPLLLMAHHQDDQAETVLLQLLRGSGTAGLSGMDRVNTAPDLLGDADLLVGRPLLSASRTELEALAADRAIACIEDESNADTRYARNALRHHVMPALARWFPGFQERFARSAQHAQAAQRLLTGFAAQDLANCLDGECLDVEQLRQLDSDRIDNLLRHWFGTHGVRMPSTAWLIEVRMQLLDAKADARLCVTHPDCKIRRHRNRVFLTFGPEIDPSAVRPMQFRWNGEAELHFASYGGTLQFDMKDGGLDTAWLMAQDLAIRYRDGGERLKLAVNRPTRSLKQHYQALNVPSWERERLPLVLAGNQLLFAAGIGMDCRHANNGNGAGIRISWRANVR